RAAAGPTPRSSSGWRRPFPGWSCPPRERGPTRASRCSPTCGRRVTVPTAGSPCRRRVLATRTVRRWWRLRPDQRLEDDVGMVALDRPRPPLVGEEHEQLAVLAVDDLDAPLPTQRRGPGGGGAPRHAVA